MVVAVVIIISNSNMGGHEGSGENEDDDDERGGTSYKDKHRHSLENENWMGSECNDMVCSFKKKE